MHMIEFPIMFFNASENPSLLTERRAPSWQITRFYVPLAIQALSQSLTYPLVASIVTHGRLGADEYAAFAQGQSLMFVLGALGGGLITTGMVFGRSRTGMANFQRLTLRIAGVVALLQVLICLPPFDTIMFSRVLGLNDSLASIARWTMFLGIPMQFGFSLRNKPLVALYNERKSGLANAATLGRIALTACLSPLFVHLGLTGYVWGSVAMTVPVFGEVFLTRVFGRRAIEALTDDESDEKAPLSKQLHFTIPLSFGGIMLSLSSFMIAVFLARAEHPEVALSVHYIVMGMVNPLGFAAIRMQSVVIAFPPQKYGTRQIFNFAFWGGLLLSAILLLFQFPGLSNWYFGRVQNLSDASVSFAKTAVLLVAVVPLLQALRGHAEGLAAVRRRPNAILSGQAMYFATMVLSLFVFLETKAVPGYLMGGLSILLSLTMAVVTVRIALVWNDFEDSYGDPMRRDPRVNLSEK